MIYEIRVYQAADGKAETMKQRFKNEVIRRLPRHGIELLGVFETEAEPSQLTYLTRFKSEDDRAKAWAAFGADPEWLAVKTATEMGGPLLKSQSVSVLTPSVEALPLS